MDKIDSKEVARMLDNGIHEFDRIIIIKIYNYNYTVPNWLVQGQYSASQTVGFR